MARPVSIPAILFSLFAATAMLHGSGWTAGAATGAIDEGDLGKILLNNDGAATIRSSISSTSAKIRFNITDVDGVEPVFESSRPPSLSMTYRDNGSGASVIAMLKRVRIGSNLFLGSPLGKVDLLATIDSEKNPASDQWQEGYSVTKNVDAIPCCLTGLLFPDFAYIVEVELIKHDASGNPGVLGVQFWRDRE
jgi:hypothetical protein